MKKIKGFSLLETIVSLSILGLMISCFSLLFFAISTTKKNKINEQKFHYIRIAIQNYVLQNGKLPAAAKTLKGESIKQNTVGFLPYKTLGITKSYALDANNQPFKYVVNELFLETNLAIHTPLTYQPKPGETSFLRLYYYDENGTLHYDYYSKKNQLEIIDQNSSVISENDNFYVMAPLKGQFQDVSKFHNWIKKNEEKIEERKVRNVVAWAIISLGKNSTCKEHEENKNNKDKFYVSSSNKTFTDKIFYQTRFDLAAQIGFYSTPEPIYETESSPNTCTEKQSELQSKSVKQETIISN